MDILQMMDETRSYVNKLGLKVQEFAYVHIKSRHN